jgi:branched-chain amino acid transport system permease protein
MSRLPSLASRGEIAAIVILLLTTAVPLLTRNVLVYSLTNQILIATIAAFSVYIMLRMDLLSFALPAFMALGGYSIAIASKAGIDNLGVLILISFAVPALVALPLGALVLRLRGTYFVLVTFAFNEVMQLLLFETPKLTGGSNGIAGVPPSTLFGYTFASNQSVLVMTSVVAVIAALVTAAVTLRYRREFASISENETLARSLGLVTWRYKSIGFVVAAGVAGLAGFALVNMLLTAHPSSFTTMSGFSYIVYAIVGGRSSMLGPLLGAAVLTSATQMFASKGEYSPALYGVLMMVVVMVAKGGIVGLTLPAGLKRRRGHLPEEPAKEAR